MNAGCFDSYGYRLAKCLACGGKGRRRIDPTSRLLDDCPDCNRLGYQRADIPSLREIATFEEELLGITLTDVNRDLYDKYAKRIGACEPLSVADTEDKKEVKVVGVITGIDHRRTGPDVKYNPDMPWAKVTVQWEGEELTFAAFPKVFEDYGFMLKPRNLGEFILKTGPKGAQMKKGYHFH